MALLMKQMTHVDEKTSEKIFPTVSTATDSLMFVKHLTSLAIPTILFLRKILPESEFESKIFEGLTLKILKRGSRSANADRIETWLSGAYDALEKKYLKSMSLEIRDTQSDLSLEIYTISITNNVNGASMSVHIPPMEKQRIAFREQKFNIKLQTVRLLQTCYTVTKACLNLPAQVTIFMQLCYQDHTPSNYHPFGYKPYIPTMPIFMEKTRSFEIGVVDTGYHVIQFRNKTCLCDESILPKAKKEKNIEEIKKEKESEFDFKDEKETLPPVDYPKNQENSFSSQLPDSQISKTFDDSFREISSQCTEDLSQSDNVRCPCLSKIKTSVMYQCSGCNYWVHAECFGIRVTKVLTAIKIFYCQICDKLNVGYNCPDELMMKLKRACDQQKLAVKRRLLGFCNRFEGQEVTFRKLERVSGLSCQTTLLGKVLKHLNVLGVLTQQPGDVYRINKNKVAQIMLQFFNTGSNLVPERSPRLGKRKIENNGNSTKTAINPVCSLTEKSVIKGLAKQYIR